MRNYILNLLPRVRQYSQSLDKIELFIDKPWVILDEDNNQQKYIFRRNGELIMSLNGQVTTGRWEYIFAAKSLIIDRRIDKIMLNQDFVDPAVMVLKMDGNKEQPFLMANEMLIPDLNIGKYLQELYIRKNGIEFQPLESGEILEVHTSSEGMNKLITIDGELAPDGIMKLANINKYFNIVDSMLLNVMKLENFKVKDVVVSVLQVQGVGCSKGNNVFISNKPAPDGKYQIGFWDNIHVKDGKIVKITMF